MIHEAEWAVRTVESVLLFRDSPAVRQGVAEWGLRLAALETSILESLGLGTATATGSEEGTGSGHRVPVRLTRGPLDFGLPASRLEPGAAAWYGSPEFPFDGNARFELVNFINGERTVTDIRDALSAEFGPIPEAAVARYIEDLVEVGVVEWAESAGVSVEVADTGPGIPRSEQERIFERFHQTESSERRRYGGAGIGLALAQLADQHAAGVKLKGQAKFLAYPLRRQDQRTLHCDPRVI